MARRTTSPDEDPISRQPPAKTPEERERQLQSYAVNLAERQLLEGTASAQVITHYLKGTSTRELLELEKLRRENILLGAKAEAMESAKRMEALYAEAITAMRSYAGQDPLAVESEMLDDDADDY